MEEDLMWLEMGEIKVQETLRNLTLSKLLVNIVKMAKAHENIENEITKQMKTLLYHLGTRLKQQCHQHLPLIVRYVVKGKMKNEMCLTLAMDYLLSHAVGELNEAELLANCGADVLITPEQIEDKVAEVILKYKHDLLRDRYQFSVGKIVYDVKSALKFADGNRIKQEVDARVMILLGPKNLEEMIGNRVKKVNESMKQSMKDSKVSKTVDVKPVVDATQTTENGGIISIDSLMKRLQFHQVGENFKTDGYVITPKTMDLLKKHVKAVGGKVVTRFPPEPNGVLHIGHAKAINIDFGYAKAHGGICYLRFDDTNPEKEEERFFRDIEDVVRWLGYEPYTVTHSSDYFDKLYQWAIELIKKDLAYVCHQRVDEIRGHEVVESPWRNRPIDESLKLFEDMRRGVFDEGEATLRLKMKLEEGKSDPVAYRIKYCAHHRTGDKWCIYPTYDYTHCLCDSIENITHSMCTKEFQSRRSSYYWLCNALNVYCPVQWEYGRLNMNYTVVSKRKIKTLIDSGIVSDWDDPRLFTLTALRRRGVPPEAINTFVANLGVTGAQMSVDTHMFDAFVRDYLNPRTVRIMAVLEPLKVVIENFDELSLPSSIEVEDMPTNPEKKHSIAVDRIIFIENSDYRSQNTEKNYRRLSKTQSVGLKHLGIVLMFVSEVMTSANALLEIVVRGSHLTNEVKPKAFIHWVAKPMKCEVRLYERLFKHRNPEDRNVVPGGFISDCNFDSLNVVEQAYIDKSVSEAKLYDRFQFERIGFFCVDQESTPSKLVFNRTVSLKEDSSRN